VTILYGKKEYYDYELNWNQTQVQIKFKCKYVDPWYGCMGRLNPEQSRNNSGHMIDNMIPNLSCIRVVIKEKIKRSKPTITEKLYKIDNSN